MPVLCFEIETVRGPVRLTSDLAGLKNFEISDEIDRFFLTVLSLKCAALKVDQEHQNRIEEIQKSYASSPAPVYPETKEQDPVMVIP